MRSLHFVLAANNSSSQTRVTAEYANALVRRGLEVTVSVPRFDFFDFVQWKLRHARWESNHPAARLERWIRWMGFPMLRSVLVRRPWFGEAMHRLDPRVRVNRYGHRPTRANMPDADVVIAFQCYLLPHLLCLPPSKGRVVGSIRLDYQAGCNDPLEEVAKWRIHCNSFYRRLAVPLFAVSRWALESAQAMGVNVSVVIPNGVNGEEFGDGGRRGPQDPLRVTLFAQHHPQKGREFGCALVERLRRWQGSRGVLFCAVGGNVKPSDRPLFDTVYGYLTGREYVRMFQQTDVFIYPSLYEGFPAVPLEAMSCGCALATTWVSGVEEYAAHGDNCLTAAPGDVEAMFRNVQSLILDSRLRDRVREGGLRTASRYSWEAATDRLMEFLKSLEGGGTVDVGAAAAVAEPTR